jgi:hypothetical protein
MASFFIFSASSPVLSFPVELAFLKAPEVQLTHLSNQKGSFILYTTIINYTAE